MRWGLLATALLVGSGMVAPSVADAGDPPGTPYTCRETTTPDEVGVPDFVAPRQRPGSSSR
jgi:hypothetical protein